MDWRNQPIKLPKQPSLPPQSSGSSSDESDESDQPPNEYFKDLKLLFPNSYSKIELMKFWDQTSGIGKINKKEIYNLESIRVQAIIGLLLDSQQQQQQQSEQEGESLNSNRSITPIIRSNDSNGDSNDRIPLFKSPSPPTPSPLFKVEEVESSSDIEIENSQDVIKRRLAKVTASITAIKTESKDKGKGKQVIKESVIIIDSDSDEDSDDSEVQVFSQDRGSNSRSRLKRRRSPSPPITPLRQTEITEEEAIKLILSIVPDVSINHLKNLIQLQIKIDHLIDSNSIVDELLSGINYPKIEGPKVIERKKNVEEVDKKGKGKKRARMEDEEEEEEEEVDKKDYLVIKGREPVDDEYKQACLEQLYVDYDRIPSTMIRNVLKIHFNFYSPTYVALATIIKRGEYEPMSRTRPEKKLKSDEIEIISKELELEKKWLKKTLMKEREEHKKQKLLLKEEKFATKNGLLIECQCCFGDFVFDRMISCTEAHLFCRECITNLVKTQVGSQQYKLECMTSECTGSILESNLNKIVSNKLILLLNKIRLEKELDEAGLDELVKCPLCPYACLMENDQERLFRCQREGCEKVTCRQCKKLDHLPKTCVEAKKDDNLGIVHGVEEAMSEAAIRNCPKCKAPYIKSDGCNLINCSSCRTASCFICRKLVSNDHSHFAQFTRGATSATPIGCPMFDDTEVRTHAEIERARKVATYTALQHNPQVTSGELDPLALIKPVRLPPNQRLPPLPPPPPFPFHQLHQQRHQQLQQQQQQRLIQQQRIQRQQQLRQQHQHQQPFRAGLNPLPHLNGMRGGIAQQQLQRQQQLQNQQQQQIQDQIRQIDILRRQEQEQAREIEMLQQHEQIRVGIFGEDSFADFPDFDPDQWGQGEDDWEHEDLWDDEPWDDDEPIVLPPQPQPQPPARRGGGGGGRVVAIPPRAIIPPVERELTAGERREQVLRAAILRARGK